MFQQTTPTLFHSKQEMEEILLNHCTALMKSVPPFPTHTLSQAPFHGMSTHHFLIPTADFSGGRNSLCFVDLQWWSPLAFESLAGSSMSLQPVHSFCSCGKSSFARRMIFNNDSWLTSVDRLIIHVSVYSLPCTMHCINVDACFELEQFVCE